MNKILSFFVAILLTFWASIVLAVDVATLDKVSVLMTRDKVLAILGKPAEKTVLSGGLAAEIYSVSDAHPLIYAGLIYDAKNILVGQSLVFQGQARKDIVERLKQQGYTLLPNTGDSARLAGFDDDTGRPLVVVIEHHENLTTITTLEKVFYEQYVK